MNSTTSQNEYYIGQETTEVILPQDADKTNQVNTNLQLNEQIISQGSKSKRILLALIQLLSLPGVLFISITIISLPFFVISPGMPLVGLFTPSISGILTYILERGLGHHFARIWKIKPSIVIEGIISVLEHSRNHSLSNNAELKGSLC